MEKLKRLSLWLLKGFKTPVVVLMKLEESILRKQRVLTLRGLRLVELIVVGLVLLLVLLG